MSDTWIANLSHFLSDTGEIAPPEGPARRLAEHFVAIVTMTSHPDIPTPSEYQLPCRRRPNRKPCAGLIESDLDPENDDILWWCPICGDNGRISNWQGTFWDLGGASLDH